MKVKCFASMVLMGVGCRSRIALRLSQSSRGPRALGSRVPRSRESTWSSPIGGRTLPHEEERTLIRGVRTIRRMTLFCVVIAFTLSMGTPSASAEMVKVPVEGAIVYGTYDDPGVWWQTGTYLRGSWQQRGATSTQWWEGSGYLAGTAQVVYNIAQTWTCNEALECKVTGRLWGTIVFHPDAYPDGGWEGTFTHRFTSFEDYTGMLEARGFGELEGSFLRLDAQGHECTGYVLMSDT